MAHLREIMLSLLVATASGLPAASAPEVGAKCKIGRPFYCDKHAGTHCASTNTSKQLGACAAWRDGCFDCHTAANACLGNTLHLRAAKICGRCQAAWTACMAGNQRRHWPGQN